MNISSGPANREEEKVPLDSFHLEAERLDPLLTANEVVDELVAEGKEGLLCK